jgi:predicted metal-dependent HD superfamily phosphohydrolase
MTPETRAALGESWTRFLTVLGCPAAALTPAFADLTEHYAAPERHYHTLDHIHAVLETLRALGATEATPALLLAAWFHDVIYDSRTSDNEEKSAAHARSLLHPLGVSEEVLDEAERLILLTKTHSPMAGDRPGEMLVDADLSILGAAESAYDAYAQAIRREYAWVAEADYRRGRRAVLLTFLQRPRIYSTAEMFARAEQAARRNLRREIALLN